MTEIPIGVNIFQAIAYNLHLHAKPYKNNIVLLDHIILVLLAHQMLGLDFAFAAQAQQVADRHYFGADKAPGKIGVDAVGGLQGGAALTNQPGADFFFPAVKNVIWPECFSNVRIR